jgi:hypothetical protein
VRGGGASAVAGLGSVDEMSSGGTQGDPQGLLGCPPVPPVPRPKYRTQVPPTWVASGRENDPSTAEDTQVPPTSVQWKGALNVLCPPCTVSPSVGLCETDLQKKQPRPPRSSLLYTDNYIKDYLISRDFVLLNPAACTPGFCSELPHTSYCCH